MQYGLIGEKLRHSFSKELHAKIGDYPYELRELNGEEFREFFARKDFRAVNVTIPYKEAVIPYLDRVATEAKKIGAVNLVCNENGTLCGYNTDYYGAKRMIERANIQIRGKKALILGSGGTRRTVSCVLQDIGAKEIVTVSRHKSARYVTYDEAKTLHCDADVIVNATPVGTFPKIDESPISLRDFPCLSGVIDVIYNPLRTKLTEEAAKRNIPCTNGLFMLTAQAVYASAIMRGVNFDERLEALCNDVYAQILREKQNIVLIGMPTSGKTTIGKLLSEKTGKRFIDTDLLTEERLKKSVAEIFESGGENAFRAEEKISVAEAAANTGCVIATGGGTILDGENLRFLKKNGKIFFLDRPYSLLFSAKSRPLSSSPDALRRLYEERLPKYIAAADERILNDGDKNAVAEKILSLL